MKKILLLFVIISAVFSACSKSPEQKAEELIQKELKKMLFKPETYQSVSTEELSINGQEDNYIIHAGIKEAESVFKDIKEYKSDVDRKKSTLNIWSDPYSYSYFKNEYNDAKEKYDEAMKKLTEAKEEAKEKVNVILTLLNTKTDLLGHKYLHNYRANNNMGNTLIGNMVFFVDDKYEKVLYADQMESFSNYAKIINGLTRKIKPKAQYSDEEIEEAVEYFVENAQPSFSLF